MTLIPLLARVPNTFPPVWIRTRHSTRFRFSSASLMYRFFATQRPAATGSISWLCCQSTPLVVAAVMLLRRNRFAAVAGSGRELGGDVPVLVGGVFVLG